VSERPVVRITRKGEQSLDTRRRLIEVARELFAERGYAATALEDLVARAGMTRGALYHHYADKKDLFRAVFEAVEQQLGERIARAAAAESDPWAQIRAGARAFLEACPEPAMRRIVLMEGLSVLGMEDWHRIVSQYAYGMVRAVLEVNMEAGNLPPWPIEPLTHLIVGALNEAGLALAAAADPNAARDEFAATLDRVLDAFRAAARPATPAPGRRARRKPAPRRARRQAT
jgi:AcrR family transcriptional regulator